MKAASLWVPGSSDPETPARGCSGRTSTCAVVGDEHAHCVLWQQGEQRVEKERVAALDQQTLAVQVLLLEAIGHAGHTGIVGELLRLHRFGRGCLQDALGARRPFWSWASIKLAISVAVALIAPAGAP